MAEKRKAFSVFAALAVTVSILLVIFIGVFVFRAIFPPKTKISISTADASKVYDGTPLRESTYYITSGSLEDGHKLTVKVNGSQTEPGSSYNYFSVKITDKNGYDVTDEYNITYIPGILTVYEPNIPDSPNNPDQPNNPSTPNNPDQPGAPDNPSNPGGSSGNNTGNNSGNNSGGGGGTTGDDSGNGSGNGSGNNSGNNSGGGGGGNLSGGGVVEFETLEGILYIKAPRTAVYYLRYKSFGDFNGTDWNAPSSTYSASGASNPLLFPSYALQKEGYESEKLTVITSLHQSYSTYHFTNSEICADSDTSIPYVDDTDYDLNYFYEYDVSVLKNLSLSGTAYENAEKDYRSFVYRNYLSVSAYEKSVLIGLAEDNGISASDPDVIEKVADYIKNAATYNLDYTPYPDDQNHVIYFLTVAKEGVCAQYAAAATLMYRSLGIPSRYVIGYASWANANEITEIDIKIGHAWTEVYIDGLGWIPVEVTPPSSGNTPNGGNGGNNNSNTGDGNGNNDGNGGNNNSNTGDGNGGSTNQKPVIKLYPSTVSKKYDGTPLYPEEKVSGFEDWEKQGYSYSVTVSGSQTDYGYGASKIESITIFDPSGNEVNDDFDIKTGNGRIHVYYSVITARSESITKTYDDKAIDMTGMPYSGELMPGHSVQFLSSATRDVGTKLNLFTAKVIDEQGNDVTDHYKISKSYGRLYINPLEITLKAGSATRAYNGSALTSDTYEIAEGALVSGHKISSYTTFGSQTEAGRSENIITSVVISDSKGNDVTKNYSVILLPGQLKVTVK